jgi:phage terminase small subunit
MAKGGYRPGSGPAKGTKYRPRAPKPDRESKPKAQRKARNPKRLPDNSLRLSARDAKKAADENLDPLAYMLKVMNDPEEDKNRRDRMAIAAAPFCHPRKGEGLGKKEEKDNKAKSAGSGKFAPSAAPLKVVK